MTSLIVQSLGYFWTYLFFSQTIVFGLGDNYPPIIGTSGYTLWASLVVSNFISNSNNYIYSLHFIDFDPRTVPERVYNSLFSRKSFPHLPEKR